MSTLQKILYTEEKSIPILKAQGRINYMTVVDEQCRARWEFIMPSVMTEKTCKK